MKVELMRSEITKVYPGKNWKTKVKNMSDVQVIAVYHSFLRNDRFKSQLVQEVKTTKDEPIQLTFDDILGGIR